jgi:nitrite reductase/ring-hydroxylating ferredoxin subunit
MARLIKVAEANELPPGQGKLVQVDGRDIALFSVNGTYCAMDAVCPHEAGPLYEGEVDGDTIVCPWRGYDFSVKTGECSVDPDLRVMTYIVKTEGNDVLIEMA